MYCPNCKKELGDDANFCPECGGKTIKQIVSQHTCSHCGEVLEEDMAFCPECGTPVGKGQKQEKKFSEQPQFRQTGAPEGYGETGARRERPQQQGAASQGVSGHEPQKQPKKGGQIGLIIAGVAALAVVCGVAFFLLKSKGEDKAAEDTATAQTQEEEEVSITIEPEKEEKKEEKPVAEDSKTVSVIGGEKEKEKGKEEQKEEPKEEEKTLTGKKDKTAQQEVLSTGGQLDLQHMGNLLANAGASYGTYVLDITNLQEYDGGGAEDPLPASALIGVPILFTIADGVDKGEISLDTQVTFSYTFANGRGVFKSSDNGRTFPVTQMLSEALLNSDNNALNSLMDFLTLERINDTCHSYGFNSVDMQRKLMSGSSNLENYISAKDAAMMLNAVYQDNFTGIGKAFLEANFKIAGNDTANRGMYPACTDCDTFLNLNGITESRYNEIGLIKKGEEVFILSVFTCNGVGTTSASALTTLTDYVVNTLQAQ